ncbi:PREDICTED: AT-hook motif nuclear-localized protein 5-like isoform X2 [Nicotiana attenuata]|uniref:AT-hook motif nuclear-localized protein 5-like isoform X2 n=1 Tax=Nicotiana attenuata TaxID=49451 RepID=UPI0009053498|nr:PREDICTED: AT-hook motif nuclear-localized protein 5-like isoform X2 [Nicotiana attenuata]
MDVREGMTLSGSAANYYLNRGISGSGSGPSPGAASGTGTPSGVPVSPGFKSLTNANIAVQSNIGSSSTGNVNSTYQVENPSPNFGHGINISMASSVSPSGSDPVKKKRGRPRKYGPDGTNMSLALSPLSSNPSSGGSITPGPKRIRGRPPGSGWKQQLAAVGEWMSSSAGLAFTPHVIHIGVGEGRFEILCLSGSYLVAENGGPRNRTGGISISVCSPDGHVIGGAIGGRLIAASPVQVVVCSFVYDPKVKSKPESTTPIKEEKESAEKSSTPIAATPSQDPTSGSGTGVWPPSSRPDVRNSQTGIDLTRG